MEGRDWIQFGFIGIGIGAQVFLSIDRWVHGRFERESKLSDRLEAVEKAFNLAANRASDVADRLQNFVGIAEVKIAVFDQRLAYLEREAADKRARER